MDKKQHAKPATAESQIRTWIAVLVAGVIALAAGQGEHWEPVGQIGAFLTVSGVIGILWLLASDRDKRD